MSGGIIGAVKDGIRELRRVPALRAAFEKTDPRRRAARLAASGLIDTQLYAMMIDRDEITAEEAAHHYVTWGHWAGLSINLLLDDAVLRRNLGDHGRPPAFDYLWRGAFDVEVSPFWSVADYVSEHPDARSHPNGPAGHLWDAVRADPDAPIPERTLTGDHVTTTWRELRQKHLADLATWAESDALRRRRRLGRHFHGVDGLGAWPVSKPEPLVSIVLATWNRAGELRRAVESVLTQSWTQWELLIVDDGSWDDTAIVAGLLSDRDARIRYLPREHAGVSAARNAGIEAATGEFITFLDSDNMWERRFLLDMMIAMSEGDDVSAFATLEVDDGERRLFREAPADLVSLEHGNVIDLNVLVSRTEAVRGVGGFDVTLDRAVDYDLILRLAQHDPIRHIPIIGAIYSNQAERTDRISTSQPLGWNTAVRVKNLLDWSELDAREFASGADVVVIVPSRDPHALDRIQAASTLAADEGVDVHLAVMNPDPSTWMLATAARDAHSGVHVHLFPGHEPFAYVVTMLLAAATHERFVVVEPGLESDADAVRMLLNEVDAGAHLIAAPLLLHRDGTVVTVGAGLPKPGSVPVDLLSRHPLEDALALGDRIDVPLLSGRSFALPTADLVAVRGLDPLLYNELELPALVLALREKFGAYRALTLTDARLRRLADDTFPRIDPLGSTRRIRSITRTVPATDFESLLAPLDMHVSHFQPVTSHERVDSGAVEETVDELAEGAPAPSTTALLPPRQHLHPVMTRERRLIEIDGRTVPRLRWALRIGSPAGPVGDRWGDTHFANSLAAALRSIGQEVVIDRHEVRARPTAYLDDVTLVLRGLDDVRPTTGGVSMLWVISHPDMVTRAEVAHFDLAFAASVKWARESSTRWGLDVRPLLQCTDPELFHPSGAARTDDFVFVGKSRGVPRPSVVEPVNVGIPVRVFGEEWEGILPEGTVEAPFIPNDQLSGYYETAGAVLNDHWSDMKREGFISNRLFDVVAAGGRAYSDQVEGIEEIFGGAVRTFGDEGELVELMRSDTDAQFADTDQLAALSERVRLEHSFRARAEELLAGAIERLGLDS